jgi:Zn ribbon nucleic-acid-binding protein
MSGTSGIQVCPNCQKETLETYFDWKPFETASGECYECGFFYYTVTEQMNLEVLNEGRKERELKPLEKLPPMEEGL